jgi:radical SAM protein with 4Fe4S-binding SPASM domain
LDGVDDFTEDSFKDYSDPVELIVSPDGYLYPEFDFLDYRQEHLRSGKWRDGVEIYEDVPFKMREECESCPTKNICGLKYARQEFDLDFKTFNCRKFLILQQMTFKHINKLKNKTLLEHVGI